MSDIVIKAENLGKKYVIGHQAENGRYVALRDVLMQNARTLWNKTKDLATGKPIIQGDTMEEIWALKDVNFEVRRGEAVGIIGRNGAGKSTLLKILSRITEPTTGRVTIKGRVASLLEVGTGFHPELTGRENIYLNGAILGMTRVEIKRKFDEIVAFAEMEKYLDTPVKRYSSGMYVRLAFAVAAHLEPEILVVDEVLAVGDAAFQKKCSGKMGHVAQEGRTVLFVSHNMDAIEALCSRCVVLKNGEVFVDADVQFAVAQYLESGQEIAKNVDLSKRTDRQGTGEIRCNRFRVIDENGKECEVITSGKRYTFEIECINHSDAKIEGIIFSLDMYDEKDNKVMLLRSNFENKAYSLVPGRSCVRCVVKDFPYTNGNYSFSIYISRRDADVLDFITNVGNIQISGGNFFNNGSNGLPTHCKFLVRSNWLP
ncbi:MAG: ABC transporter ATP-binding protein [Syntrophales bacterium]